MKKTILLFAIVALMSSCKKTKDENPKPDFDASEWANLGNDIFSDDPLDSIPMPTTTPVTTVHARKDNQLK